MLALGNRAGVSSANPHRFRDTLAIDMLKRGASPYDVAKMHGDTIGTVEKHYTPFVKELRERVRSILESGAGLESTVTLRHNLLGQTSKFENKRIGGSRTCKPNSPGGIAGTQLTDSKTATIVNDVNRVTSGRFYVTRASQSQRSPERQ